MTYRFTPLDFVVLLVYMLGTLAGISITVSEWAPHPNSASTTRPSAGEYSLPQAPISWPSDPASGR